MNIPNFKLAFSWEFEKWTKISLWTDQYNCTQLNLSNKLNGWVWNYDIISWFVLGGQWMIIHWSPLMSRELWPNELVYFGSLVKFRHCIVDAKCFIGFWTLFFSKLWIFVLHWGVSLCAVSGRTNVGWMAICLCWTRNKWVI